MTKGKESQKDQMKLVKPSGLRQVTEDFQVLVWLSGTGCHKKMAIDNVLIVMSANLGNILVSLTLVLSAFHSVALPALNEYP